MREMGMKGNEGNGRNGEMGEWGMDILLDLAGGCFRQLSLSATLNR
jgi:hypothetical protein